MNEQLTWYILHFINLLMPYAVAAVGISLISLTPLGRAAISWLKGHINRGRAVELTGDIERLRLELEDVQERLDYAERRLVAGAPSASLPPGRRTPAPGTAARTPTPV
jgi:uncharacterized protein YbjT (DUF2867 family)